ncbi:diguanylate cyclase (GGDEF) domain-containing protein [Colwellia chukchiensis]|uniref:diguanylate cyclase n=1 Tax=Colwellia chukchiensis TaxID=641665 RepID=A0A1H7HX75_9GAMM|nr:tetratricopeptide repeat-containing diguanylate cyclase [Colwellia chukchiensis]SEK53750.1 diguanylate cyclase (GGDEF) domain-containing protein [Colwellia chukchiensis]
MTKALQACYATLFILLLNFPVAAVAKGAVNFSDMEHEINLQPWRTYQKLLGLQSTAESYDELTYLWWLVRKAQAENLIYFYDEFNQTVKQANSLINGNTPPEIQTRLLFFQGLIERRNGQFSDAIVTFTEALKLANNAKLSSLYIFAKQELAYTQTLTEVYTSSLLDMQAAYIEAFALQDQYLIATINETYGAIYGYLDDFEQSIAYYQRALDGYQNLQYPAHIAEALYGLASTYRYWKKYDIAIKYFKKYQQQIGYTPNSNISFFSAYGLGMTLAEKGDCEQALSVIKQALALKGVKDYNAELYKRQASCLISFSQLAAAEQALASADAIFAEMPELRGTTWQIELLKIKAELAHAHGQHESAYELLKQYNEQYIQLLIKNSTQRLLEVRANQEGERKTVSEDLQRKSEKIAQLQQERMQTINAQHANFNVFVAVIALIVLLVIVAQYRSNRKMQLLTIKDPLSGLYNRRYIFDYLNDAVAHGNADKMQLSIILIDIDDFKKINDRHGHPVGDEVIRKVADVGREVFRQEDIFGRIGGEEFLCVLPRTEIGAAEQIAERFLTLINQSTLVKWAHEPITVSIGIAALSSQCHDINQLYINADQALYQAKGLGKNQINVFNSPA